MPVPDLSFLKDRETILITMVCYGNICRSPMAAAVLSSKVASMTSPTIVVDSAGTADFNVGQSANPPSQRIWERAGYRYNHRASHFTYSRLVAADLVLVMDDFNRGEVGRLVTSDDEESKIFYLREFDSNSPKSLIIPDPYLLPDRAFEEVLEMVEKSTDGLVAELLR